ncbi:MAG: hypothetical protein ACREIU_09210 [Planctomycetota bacterium]
MFHRSRFPTLLLLLAPVAAAASGQEEPAADKAKEPPRFALRLGYGKDFGWISTTKSVREQEASLKQKFEFSAGGETQKHENEVEYSEHEDLDSRVKMEFLEAEGGEVRRARYTLEEQRYRRRRERDGEVVEKDDAPKSAEIEGCEIAFRWGDEENEVEVKGGSLEKDEREGFTESLKHRDLNPFVAYLLPKDPVAVGETWTLEGRPVRQILNHALGDSEDEARARKALPKDEHYEADLSGELRAKLEEVLEKDGRRIAVVSVAGKPKEEGSSESEGSESTWKASYEVSGTLRFAVDLGMPEEVEFSASAKKSETHSGEQEAEAGEGEGEKNFSFSGSSTVTLKREFRTVSVPLHEPEADPGKK